MKIVLTGGTGFIGSYVVNELLSHGHELTLLARNPQKISGFRNKTGLHFVETDLKDIAKLSPALKGQDAFIHIALCWGDSPAEMLINDTLTSVKLMEESAGCGIRKFIYTSSTAALGAFKPLMDCSLKTSPIDYYGAAKASAENYLLAISSQTGLASNIIRPGYTFGNPVVEGAPMQPDNRFREIVSCAMTGKDIILTKYDGTQFIWAGDLAKIYTAVLRGKESRKTYHGLSRNFTSWQWIAEQTCKILGSRSRIIIEDKGWSEEPMMFELKEIRCDFHMEFDSQERILEHIGYISSLY